MLILIYLLTTSVVMCSENRVNQEQIGESTKIAWTSLSSVQFVSDELIADLVQGTSRLERYYFALEDRGQYALRAKEVKEGREYHVHDFREDGQKSYQSRPFRDSDDSLNSVTIRYQTSTESHYKGMMFRVLWLLMPGGEPIFRHIEQGASVEPARDVDGNTVYVVHTSFRGSPIRCEVDPQHDWLVRRMTLGEGLMDVRVTRFDRVDGRWFPVEGSSSEDMTVEGRRIRKRGTFRVSQLRINQPLDPGLFHITESKLPSGTKVIDSISGRTRYIGGRSARDRRISEQLEQPEAPGTELSKGLTIVHVPRRKTPAIYWWLAACSPVFAVIAVAYFFYWQAKRRRA
jgi:hypothetical protein